MVTHIDLYGLNVFFFFFSSRRRHTRLQGDWSSDVCSSDLNRNVTQRQWHWYHCASAAGDRGMRLCMTGLAVAVALGTVLSGCAGPTGLVIYGVGPNGAYPYEFPRVDREQAAERTVEGAAIGA